MKKKNNTTANQRQKIKQRRNKEWLERMRIAEKEANKIRNSPSKNHHTKSPPK